MPFSFGESPIFAGQSVQVTCFVTEGDQPIDISWDFSETDSIEKLGIITTKIGIKASFLNIDYVDSQHSGNYSCTARNSAGVSIYSATLNINGNNLFKKQKYRLLIIGTTVFCLQPSPLPEQIILISFICPLIVRLMLSCIFLFFLLQFIFNYLLFYFVISLGHVCFFSRLLNHTEMSVILINILYNCFSFYCLCTHS